MHPPVACEVAHRFVRLVRHPDAGQFARSVQDRELSGVAPIRLDPLARFARYHRRGSHRTSMTEVGQMAVDNVAATTGFVAKLQPMAVFGEPLGKLGHGDERVRNRPHKGDKPVAPVFRTVTDMLAL
jgi:hypothetical protein